MHAVVLAGGQGTRLRPLTDARPKPLVSFMGEPFAVGLLRRLAGAGCTRVWFLVGADAAAFTAVAAAGRDLGIDVAVHAEDRPLDTAGAARRLLRAVDEPVLVCNGDVLTDLDYADLARRHAIAGATATLALARVAEPSSFGLVVCDPDGRVRRFVEKPPMGTVDADTVNAGTYVLAPDVFGSFAGDGPLSFERTVFPGLLAAGRVVLGVVSNAYWQDLGTPARYLDGHRAVLEGRCAWPGSRSLERSGDLVAVDATATVDPSAQLGPVVVVGAGCRIDAGATVAESVLHDGVRVGPAARVHGAILAPGVRVGAEATVAPGAVLGDDAVVEPAARVT